MTAETENLPAVARAPKPPILAGSPIMGIIPRDYDEAARMAKAVYLSGTYPDTFRSPDESVTIARVCGAILRGAEMGIPPYYALAHIIIVNNKYAIDGETAVAVSQAKGLLADIKIEYFGQEMQDDWGCRYTAFRRTPEGLRPFSAEFTVKMAKRSGLWMKKDNWIKWPERMILARARAWALREGFADCLAGIALSEEQQDLPPAPAPVNTTFLTDDTASQEVAQPQTDAILASDTPDPEAKPVVAPEAPDDSGKVDPDMEELQGYIAALEGVGTLIKLRELDDEVKAWMANRTGPQSELRGTWNQARMEREKVLTRRAK